MADVGESTSQPPPPPSSFSPPLPSLSSSDGEKIAYSFICDCYGMFRWYAFEISDKIEHNQPPPTPPPPHPNYVDNVLRFRNFLNRFHEDDGASAEVNLEPAATGVGDAGLGWAILGSNTLYRIRNDRWSRLQNVKRRGNKVERIELSSTGPMARWEMVHPTLHSTSSKESEHVLVLRGKLYCLDGLDCYKCGDDEEENKDKDKEKEKLPWAMAYDPSLDEWEPLPDPPHCPSSIRNIISAAVEDEDDQVPGGPCIVMGTLGDGLLQIYHVDTKQWERHEFEILEAFRYSVYYDLRGRTLAVGRTLYWYFAKVEWIVGYDLVTKMWFKGCVPMHDNTDFEGDVCSPRLTHLGGDMFCLLWTSVSSCDVSRLHCMKFGIITTLNLYRGYTPLEITILSCQSYFISRSSDFFDARVV